MNAGNTGAVLVMAGGTGGHVFPALAVAHELRRRGHPVEWLGSVRGIENRLVPEAGFPLNRVRVIGLRRKGALGWSLAPARLARGVLEALRLMRRLRPAVALGMGGFASGPGGLAARLLGVPLVVHEQNAVAGLTNRVLARFATRVLEAFPGSLPGALCTGNPVRDEIAALPAPQHRFSGRAGPLRLLVVGGSQGAGVLNRTVPAALRLLPPEQRPQVWHQTGPAQLETTRDAYREFGLGGRVEAFIDAMDGAYAWADLVLYRSGALTVSELAAAGLGALLVPYPHAVDDHQTRNAGFLAGAGAARILPEAGLTPAVLASEVRSAADRAKLLRWAEAARGLARPEATAVVAGCCEEVGYA